MTWVLLSLVWAMPSVDLSSPWAFVVVASLAATAAVADSIATTVELGTIATKQPIVTPLITATTTAKGRPIADTPASSATRGRISATIAWLTTTIAGIAAIGASASIATADTVDLGTKG